MDVAGRNRRRVTARLREMGIRVALGATRRQIIQLALIQALGLGAIGLGAGFLVSWALSGYLRPWLFGTSADDPLVISSAVVCLGIAVLLAGWLPARRAGLVNPLAVLPDS